MLEFDFIVVGAGSAGCAVACQLANAKVGSIAVLEAGGGDASPAVKVPFGLLHLMGSSKDWRFDSAPGTHHQSRQLDIPRGRMLGGSSSINSMVWFRGCQSDFDNWQVPGWAWADVQADFEAVEALIQPRRLPDPHPVAESFAQVFNANDKSLPPSPEYQSAAVFHTNMRNGRRWSAADAFLRPAVRTGDVHILKNTLVDRVLFENNTAKGVKLADGRELRARGGVVLSAGSVASPAILMRSGVGDESHLSALGIPVMHHSPHIGQHLQDHPTVGVHHAGDNSGYGLTLSQLPHWVAAPVKYLLVRKGALASNYVEAGAFFKATEGDGPPDVQVHFIPYKLGWQGRKVVLGSGYFADVCVARPHSRGQLTLQSKHVGDAPLIDLGLFSDERDMHTLREGFKGLRALMRDAPFDAQRAPEAYPAGNVQSDAEIEQYILETGGTAYHPVGSLQMGVGNAPVTPQLQVRGMARCWVADASIMPRVTSANTNAPSMMIGYRAGGIIASTTTAAT